MASLTKFFHLQDFADIKTYLYPLIFDYFNKVNDYLYVCEGIDLFECLLRPYPCYPSTFFISRNIHDKYLWDENFLFCQDFEFLLRICKKIPFYYIDKPLSTMGMHESQAAAQIEKKLQGDIDAIKSFSQAIDDNEIEKSVCNREIGKRYWIFGHYLRNEKHYVPAIYCYLKSLLYIENVKRLFKTSLTRISDLIR